MCNRSSTYPVTVCPHHGASDASRCPADRRVAEHTTRVEGLTDVTRHVIKCILNLLNPRSVSQMASYDVVSNICQALPVT